VLDLSWLRGEVSDCYCLDDGRAGIDPEVAIRLVLAGLLIGIVHDRKLMREAEVNIAIRWFIGYGLHEKQPHHSSLTRIRQRWGEERFRKITSHNFRDWVLLLVSSATFRLCWTAFRAVSLCVNKASTSVSCIDTGFSASSM
jgi:hypothetical protein